MDAGTFHDAHEVYAVKASQDDRWLATLRTKRMADDYAEWLSPFLAITGAVLEVRAV